jgi:hypothetical protein
MGKQASGKQGSISISKGSLQKSASSIDGKYWLLDVFNMNECEKYLEPTVPINFSLSTKIRSSQFGHIYQLS